MLSRTYCASCIGIEAITVTIEVDVSQGISFFLVGLPDSAVRESQQRISTALMTIGARIPGKKIIVNMAPADLRKEGSSFDLAIAVGILAASEQYIFNSLSSYIIMGELALDGSLRAVPGALPIAVHAREESFRGCIFPVESAMEASDIDGIVIYAAHNLADVISILLDDGVISPVKPYSEDACFDGADVNSPLWQSSFAPDFAEIKGQEHAKRGLEIAAAGGHNLLMCGIPGSGKSLMAKAFAGILPPLGRDESIETSMIYSVAGRGHSFKGLIRERPFRAPHHSSSAIAIAGGGTKAFPGEISLAHNGVLFMDELPEFSRHLLELLRQPLEERVISLSRANYKVTYPCNFQLLASMNPCPCGFYGDSAGRCTCSPYMISRYAAKVSGPLLDRIEMRLEVNAVPGERLLSNSLAESTSVIKERVIAARELQKRRFDGRSCTNSGLTPSDIKKHCLLGPGESRLLATAISRLNLSARGYGKILKVARTIADLDRSPHISTAHLAEAIQYRGS